MNEPPMTWHITAIVSTATEHDELLMAVAWIKTKQKLYKISSILEPR